VAEALKHQLNADVVRRIAAGVLAVHPTFEGDAFIAGCLDGLDDLELTARAQHISETLATFLPDDEGEAIEIIRRSLIHDDPLAQPSEIPAGQSAFHYWPYVRFLTDRGLDNFELSMETQKVLTTLFTAEFSIRTYLLHRYDDTMETLHVWATDNDVHVRRLVSEGTRPRLPWAAKLPMFMADPSPVLELLEVLKDDPEEYVRRSVANNLNDIAKDNPDVVIDVARRWWNEGDANRRRLVRHGLRTLIKAANPEALAVMGFGSDSPARVSAVRIDPIDLRIGDKIRVEVDVTNPAAADAGALVDLRFWFVKANGTSTAKVFKGSELLIQSGDTAQVRKTISLAQHSTRSHYPGLHRIEVIINGATVEGGEFQLRS
jgi:3-methyladenine DNA glycosylase AlkC